MTRNWRPFLAAAVIVLTGTLATLRGGAASYLLFECTLLVPCLSLAYLVYVFLRFRVYQNLDAKTVVKGQRVPYSFVLSNENRITYCDIRITFENVASGIDNISPDESYCLLPETQINRRTTLVCRYRGRYQVGISRIRVTDFLGLFSITYRCPQTVNAVVLPRVIHLERLVYSPKSEAEEKERELSVREEIPNMQVRQYIRGDSMRRIHWKASARTQELKTRQYTEEPRKKNLLVLDLKRQSAYSDETRLIFEDKLLECALAIADYFLKIGTPLLIITERSGYRSFTIGQAGDFQEFYGFCAEVDFSAQAGAADLVRYVMQAEEEPSNCMVLTGQADEELFASCLELKLTENQAAVFYVGDEASGFDTKKLDGHLEFRQIFLREDTKEALEG